MSTLGRNLDKLDKNHNKTEHIEKHTSSNESLFIYNLLSSLLQSLIQHSSVLTNQQRADDNNKGIAVLILNQ